MKDRDGEQHLQIMCVNELHVWNKVWRKYISQNTHTIRVCECLYVYTYSIHSYARNIRRFGLELRNINFSILCMKLTTMMKWFYYFFVVVFYKWRMDGRQCEQNRVQIENGMVHVQKQFNCVWITWFGKIKKRKRRRRKKLNVHRTYIDWWTRTKCCEEWTTSKQQQTKMMMMTKFYSIYWL